MWTAHVPQSVFHWCHAHLQASHRDPTSLQAKICVTAAQQAADEEPRSDSPERQLTLLVVLLRPPEPACMEETA